MVVGLSNHMKLSRVEAKKVTYVVVWSALSYCSRCEDPWTVSVIQMSLDEAHLKKVLAKLPTPHI